MDPGRERAEPPVVSASAQATELRQLAKLAQGQARGQVSQQAQVPGQAASVPSTGIVRAYFGLYGSGLPKDEVASDGSLEDIFRIALEDSLAVTCLYAIVVCGRGLTTPGAMSVFSDKSFWLWLVLLIICNIFLQVFYPPLRQQLVQASVFSVVLVLMSPIKTPALCA